MYKMDDITAFDPNSLSSLLPLYYKYIFPYSPYCKWLQYGYTSAEDTAFSHREFSFTLQNDIYVRYQSFNSQNELEKEMQRLNPCKIDIGAVYTHPPKDHNRYHSGTFKPLNKELVFDIDMTDYDDVRKCCQGAEICPKCWTLMKIAIKVIHQALTEDFGFHHILWVYSGRRGVHCWVCDRKARQLSSSARAAIVEYLSLVQGGKSDKRVYLRQPIHPYIQRCRVTVASYWKEYGLINQDILENDEDVKKIMKLVPVAAVGKEVEEAMKDCTSSIDRWDKLKGCCSMAYKADPKQNAKALFVPSEIMLQYCFPRLDENVTKGVNHLLKSPFCIHPKTGRVCVPIDVAEVDQFDPFSVPTISDLCLQIENVGTENIAPNSETNASIKRSVGQLYKQTTLKPYMKCFEDFLAKLLKDDCKQHAIEKSDKTGNF